MSVSFCNLTSSFFTFLDSSTFYLKLHCFFSECINAFGASHDINGSQCTLFSSSKLLYFFIFFKSIFPAYLMNLVFTTGTMNLKKRSWVSTFSLYKLSMSNELMINNCNFHCFVYKDSMYLFFLTLSLNLPQWYHTWNWEKLCIWSFEHWLLSLLNLDWN